MKLLSICIPCYNDVEYLHLAINSALIKPEEVEIIVVDDGSTDDSLMIAKGYETKYPEVVKVIHQAHGGYGMAINTGIANASGLYFKVLNSNDCFDQGGLVKVINTLWDLIRTQANLDMMVCNFEYQDYLHHHKTKIDYHSWMPQDKIFGWHSLKILTAKQIILMPAIIYKTALLKKYLNLPADNQARYVYPYLLMSNIHAIYYLDENLYIVNIRNEKKLLKNQIDDLYQATSLMIKDSDIQSIKSRNQRRYMTKYLTAMLALCTALLLKNDQIAKKDQLCNDLKRYDYNLYKAIKLSLIGRLVIQEGRLSNDVLAKVYRLLKKIYRIPL